MANPVQVADIAARWRPLSPEQTSVAEVLLADAYALLVARSPRLPQRLEAGTLSPDLVVAVVSAMVLRVMRNPDGKVSETIDDYTYRRADAVSAGALYVAADELALLAPALTRRSSSVPLSAYGDYERAYP